MSSQFIRYKISQFNIKEIEAICKANPSKKFLLEFDNTQGISSSMIANLPANVFIRIAGGYDNERVKRYKNTTYTTGETGQYFIDAVIYTKKEAIDIIKAMESIESKMDSNWDDLQKVIYIYNELKTIIKYDPEFKLKKSRDIRSLRGFIYGTAVCAGFALMFKEMLDRQNIHCEYVSGMTNKGHRHAWNIIEIDGKKYGVDLTLDSSRLNKGQVNTYDFLGMDVDTFSETYIPDDWQPTQNYKTTLSEIDHDRVKEFNKFLLQTREYSKLYEETRKDGSKFIISQIGNLEKDGISYYRYIYAKLNDDGTTERPIILYGTTNIQELKTKLEHKKADIQEGFEDSLLNVVLSRENIRDSIKNNTFFIGGVYDQNGNIVTKPSDADKPETIQDTSKFIKPYTRTNDGTHFVVQKTRGMIEVDNKKFYQFQIFEIVTVNGKRIIKRNNILTEKDFFQDDREGIPNIFLSRERLDEMSKNFNHYAGYYDSNGEIITGDSIQLFNSNKNPRGR